MAMRPPMASSHARVKGEKTRGHVGGRQDYRICVRGSDDDDQNGSEAASQGRSPKHTGCYEEDGRVQDVELLLDGQRPVVLQR